MKNFVIFILFLLGFCTSESLAILKLTYPNGGEKFVIGSDTLITWDGIALSDSVTLKYSIDNGLNWAIINDNVKGSKYIWKNVPAPTSNECLIKVEQNGERGDYNSVPEIEWQKTYGGSATEYLQSIKQTNDSGYIACGGTESKNGDFSDNKGSCDAWVIKLDSKGKLEWQKTFGTSGYDYLMSIQQTTDGGFITVGKKTYNAYLWVLKLDRFGSKEWEYSVTNTEKKYKIATSVVQTKDGNYAVLGYTSNNGDENYDILLLKLNSSGKLLWEKTYTEFKYNYCHTFQQTSDGGFIIAGFISNMFLNGSVNYILKLNSLGNFEWEQKYGIESELDGDIVNSIKQTLDGGYILAISSLRNCEPCNWMILKLDKFGNKEWEKYFGGSENDDANSALQTLDGGYIIAGLARSKDNDVKENNGLDDVWIMKLNPSGVEVWQKSIGGSLDDKAIEIQQTLDGGFIIGGYSESKNISGCTNKGSFDIYIIKLKPALQTDVSDNTFSIVAPVAQADDIDMKDCILGCTKDSLISEFVSNKGSYKFRVDSIYFSGADADAFKLVTGLPKYNLASGEVKSSNIEFTPNRIGLHTANINIISQSETLVKTIRGTGIGKLLVSIKNDSAYAGELKSLKLVISTVNPAIVAKIAPNFSAKIRFQKTILTPLKKADRNIINDSIYMNVSGRIDTSQVLAQIKVIAGLGLVEETTIDIVEFILKDNAGNKVDYEIVTKMGLFKLLGICREGGTRLIHPTGKAEILQIFPNPASDDIEITVNLIEEGATTISVINSNGTKIKEINLAGETGLRTINLNAREFTNGLYFIQLQTPTVLENKKLMIVK